MPAAPLPRLHLIVGDPLIEAADFGARLSPVLETGGVNLALHLRARTAPARRLFEACEWLVREAEDAGSLVIVNDRIDVALAAGAGGVHLREDSAPSSVAREFLGPDLLLGRSIHTAGRVGRADSAHLDYVVFGTVYPTDSHPERPPAGLEELGRAVVAAAVPVLAIGGLTPERAPSAVGSGAYGVVVRSGVWAAADPPAAVLRYLEIL